MLATTCVNVDLVPSSDPASPFLAVDLTKLGEVFECLHGADAVVHLAAIPAPGLRTEAETFEINTMSTFNVFSAACSLGLRRIVWASSETVLGLPFEDEQPDYVPVDEGQTPYPQSSYSLSKLLGEHMAAQFSRRFGVPFVGLRFSNIMEPADYDGFPDFWNDPALRKWNLWGYVDASDVAASVRLALEAEISGAEVFIVAAEDTVMNRPSADLVDEVYPEIPVRRAINGYETLLAIEKARDWLDYQPGHSWRDHIEER